MTSLSIAVIVPVGGDEAAPSGVFFERLRTATPPVSLVAAADARLRPETREAFQHAGATLFTFEEIPRGARLARAALGSPSSAEIFVFLHVDTILPAGWDGAARGAIAAGAVGGAFRLGFSNGGWRMSWVAGWANLRNRFTRMPYGDQAPFMRRDVYEHLGGHRPWPLLEDWDLARRLRGEGRVALLPLAVATSPRRYLERGVLRTVLKNWKILRKVKRGESAERLAELYRQ
ncbi:MAG TPA: hypothetical protein VF554_10100 [Thermoanaerobaculia bacterium]